MLRKIFMKIFTLCASVALLAGCAQGRVGADRLEPAVTEKTQRLSLTSRTVRNDYTPLNFAQQKAMWFAYFEISEMLENQSAAQFTDKIGAAFDNAKSLGCNTVYVHVRAFGDAYYNSELFALTKNMDPTAGYDPLEIMVAAAHERGLSIHAWINPMRCETESVIAATDENNLIRQWYDNPDTNGTYLVKIEGDEHLWLNPAYSEVRELIAAGAAEIISRYKVDGLNIDDYFYPTADEDFDEAAFAVSGMEALSEFRQSNTTLMVKALYDAVKSANPKALFGISPQGNIPNNYGSLAADVRLWASEAGYADYMAPQVYYGFQNSAAPFTQTVAQWEELVKDSGVGLVIGLAAYKVSSEEEFIKTDGILAKMIAATQEQAPGCGVALYNYSSLFAPESEFADRVESERTQIRQVWE